jgi:hypothetical protein
MRWARTAILGLVLGAIPAPAFALRHKPRVRPQAFASCARLVGYERAHFAATGGLPANSPRALSGPAVPVNIRGAAPKAAAPNESSSTSGAGFSTTNNQEPGVEEPDVVKSDGSTIFTLEQGRLFALSTKPTLHLAGSLSLPGGAYSGQLLIRGSRLLVISGRELPVAIAAPVRSLPPHVVGTSHTTSAHASVRAPVAPVMPSPYYYPATTTVTEVDASNPAAMSVAREITVEGTFVDARQNGATARLVFSSAPRAIATGALRTRAAGWVPTRRFHSFISGHRYNRPLAACSAVRRPAAFSGLGMLTILTIDLDRGLYATSSSALLADAQIVYGSQHSLYVATQKWINPLTPSASVPSEPETVIDKFDASSSDQTPLVASGAVPGYLLNQFSLSEYHGYLRVATTSKPIWWGPPPVNSQSRVTVLADRGGALAAVGEVSGLGVGQQIYSVRFLGDAGYVVTFRHVDPLYTLDLSSPSSPRVAGQLELEGYSAYLHPVGQGLLLGVGREVRQGIVPAGTQLELFDVSNPAAPRLLAHLGLGDGSSSQVQFDHHAFLFWPPTSLAVLPAVIHPLIRAIPPSPPSQPPTGSAPPLRSPVETTSPFYGAIAFRVDRAGIAELGRIAHDRIQAYTPTIERSLVIGPQLFTVSSAGVMASALSTLERQAFVAFPPSPEFAGSGAVPQIKPAR